MGPLTPHQEIKTVDHPFWEVELESVLCCTTRTGLAEDAARWSVGEVFEPDIAPGMEQALLATCFRIECGDSHAFVSVAAGTTVSKVSWIIAGWVIRREKTLGPDMVRLECEPPRRSHSRGRDNTRTLRRHALEHGIAPSATTLTLGTVGLGEIQERHRIGSAIIVERL